MVPVLDDETMTSHLDRIDRAELDLGGEHRNLKGDGRKLIEPHGIKARIGVGHRLCELHDELWERRRGVEAAKASAQIAGMQDRDEGTASDIEVDVDLGRIGTTDTRLERAPRQGQ